MSRPHQGEGRRHLRGSVSTLGADGRYLNASLSPLWGTFRTEVTTVPPPDVALVRALVSPLRIVRGSQTSVRTVPTKVSAPLTKDSTLLPNDPASPTLDAVDATSVPSSLPILHRDLRIVPSNPCILRGDLGMVPPSPCSLRRSLSIFARSLRILHGDLRIVPSKLPILRRYLGIAKLGFSTSPRSNSLLLRSSLGRTLPSGRPL